ncbi:methylthioribulose 1-phosphate dehydratase [Micromonospora sp. NPDC005686]|uniref:methylthioribulose 1-phosphate dehydratase n=1 Tax=unclassified Micromonospora TaxID=2617518 RepID=UPI0033A3BC44
MTWSVDGAGNALAETAAALYARGWLEGTAGNLSIRMPGGQTALITASGVSKGSITAADVVEVRIDDARPVNADAPRPSAETTIHAALYRLSAESQAVVHAHPPYATATAILAARRGADSVTFTDLEIIKGLGLADPSKVVVPVFDNHAQVPRIADDVLDRIAADAPPVMLIGNHGATTWGPTLDIARNRMECLEAMCQLTLLVDRS